MDMEQAFNVMLGSLHAVDAGRSQVLGVFAWRESACRAAALARACGQGAPVAGAGGTPVHGAWMRSCQAIVGALRTQENQAELEQIRASESAAAAASDRDALLAEAAATPAPAERVTLMKQAMSAERARRAQAVRAARAQEWWLAANNAAAEGEFLMRDQNRVLAPVAAAVADTGGLRETALDKHYHTAGG